MKRIAAASMVALAIALSGGFAATSYLADVFNRHAALGSPLFDLGASPVYAPWKSLEWRGHWGEIYPRPFAVAGLIEFAALAGSIIAGAALLRTKPRMTPFGAEAWSRFDDVKDAGLFACSGTVLGKLDGEMLCWDGPEHQLLIGSSRSGKGRGHVVPTLLAWPQSALVLDVKGELADGDPRHGFPGTSGFRATLGPVLRFAPTRTDSAAFNPLFEVRRGPNEIRDVQNIVEILVDPQGDGRHQDFWDRSAKSVLVGVILHVLYAEPLERKTLAAVRERLRDLDATAQAMKSTYHRRNPVTGAPEIHPEVLHAAESYLAGEERMQSGIKATAESFFGLFADELVATNTACSDFRIGDLMCADRPVTLYLQPPPSDALRLTPLLRLMVNQIARALMEHQTSDAQGHAKRHKLLLLLDEFPMLGRMPHFELMMGAMAGYGLKAALVCQSLNHIIRAYGRDNVIVDNCRIVAAYAATDADTAKRISEMAGDVWEPRAVETHQRPRALLGWRKGSTTIREERRPLILPAEVRALPPGDQLIFVAGAKPIRARKLQFDKERIFRTRLLAAAPVGARLSTAHDWRDVRALGPVAKARKPVVAEADAAPATRRASGRAARLHAGAAQPDLFGHDALRPLKISDLALRGFRGPGGEVLPPPGRGEAGIADTPPLRAARAKGV